MTEFSPPIEGNWERQRASGRFAIEPYSRDETELWLEVAGQPPMLTGENDKDYSDRVWAEQRQQQESVALDQSPIDNQGVQ